MSAPSTTSYPTRLQKLMVQPITIIFKLLQAKTPVQLWLYDNKDVRMEGIIIGFDEFMNVVLDSAAEISVKRQSRVELGRIMLKGDAICLIRNLNSQ